MQYALQTKRKEIQMTKFAKDISQPKKSSMHLVVNKEIENKEMIIKKRAICIPTCTVRYWT
jgi:hypothetical protein